LPPTILGYTKIVGNEFCFLMALRPQSWGRVALKKPNTFPTILVSPNQKFDYH